MKYSQSASDICSSNYGTITKRENSIRFIPTQCFQNGMRRGFRLLKVHSNRAIVPRIFKLMTAIRCKDISTPNLRAASLKLRV